MLELAPRLALAAYLLVAILLPLVFRKRLRGADGFEQLFTAAIWPFVAVIFLSFCLSRLAGKLGLLSGKKQKGASGR